MSKRRTLATAAMAAILVLSTIAPAASAPRLRMYRGKTSQDKRIQFLVGKDDRGRYVADFFFLITFTCEDATTQEWGMGFGFGRGLRLGERGLIDFDDVFLESAVHLHGRLGQHEGQGTLKVTIAQLTADEQAQLCTTGDLTWTAEYTRTIPIPQPTTVSRADLDGILDVQVAPEGTTSRVIRASR